MSIDLDCAVCHISITSENPHYFLFPCGDVVCWQHVVSPWCPKHSDSLVVCDLADDVPLIHILAGKEENNQRDGQLKRRVKEVYCYFCPETPKRKAPGREQDRGDATGDRQRTSKLWECTCGYIYNLARNQVCGCCKKQRSVPL